MNNTEKEKQKALDLISIGDIYEFSTWAKEDVYFYEVVKKTNSFVCFREIDSKIVPIASVPEEKRSLGLVGRMDDSEDIYKCPIQGKYTDEKAFRRRIKRYEGISNMPDSIWSFNYISHRMDGVESYMVKIEKNDVWYRDKTHDSIARLTKKDTIDDRVVKIKI